MNAKKNHKLMLKATILFSLIITPATFASLPRADAVPGGLAIIPLQYTGTSAPKVYFNHRRVMILPNKNKLDHWIALTGIALATKPGKHQIKIKTEHTQPLAQTFIVHPKQYKLAHITITKKHLVKPNSALSRKIKNQTRLIKRYLRRFRPSKHVYLDFRLPVKGRFTSPFGLRRIYNNHTRGRHTGLDIAAPLGTPVHAAATGKVIATGYFIISGNAVFIGHGQGLITSYYHLQKIKVRRGQTVKQGQVIGTVGSSGRSTGPHLHWGVALNGVRVNPKLFID